VYKYYLCDFGLHPGLHIYLIALDFVLSGCTIVDFPTIFSTFLDDGATTSKNSEGKINGTMLAKLASYLCLAGEIDGRKRM